MYYNFKWKIEAINRKILHTKKIGKNIYLFLFSVLGKCFKLLKIKKKAKFFIPKMSFCIESKNVNW